MKIFGFILMILSVVLCIGETIHFGGHLLPASRNELLSDIACAAMFIVGNIMTKMKD